MQKRFLLVVMDHDKKTFVFLGLGGVAYLLDQHRHVISVANLQCTDEQEARERAEQLVDVNDIEL